MKTARSSVNRPNDLYASKSGQVARKSSDQWQVRDNNQWQNVAPEKKPSRENIQSKDMPQRSSYQSQQRKEFNHSSMNRDVSARSRGSRGGGGRRR